MTVEFANDDRMLATGFQDDTVRLWDPLTGKALGTFAGHTSTVQSVAFSPDGKTLATGSSDNTVRLWSVSTSQTRRVLEGHASAVLCVSFSPDSKTLASGSHDNTVRLWDIATGQCLAILLATPEGWVAFTPDGRYKFGGNIAGSFWHIAGLCRFEPGELDEYLPLRLPDDAPFLSAKP
jgi:WD40 repeat protein